MRSIEPRRSITFPLIIARLSLEGMDEVRKKTSLNKFEDNIMRDDISVVIGFLQNIHQL